MSYSDDSSDRPDPVLAAARIGELTRLALWLEQPGLSLDDVRRYVAERLERLYPLDFHVYRNRWQALEAEGRPGPLLGFLEWWPLAQELAEWAAVARMLGEVDERVDALKRVLLELPARNDPAISLACKNGYELCGHLDQFFPSGEMALFFEKHVG